jgi:hypothetical protein
MFFFEKRTKKLSPFCAQANRFSEAQMDEVFLLLFVHKKKILP